MAGQSFGLTTEDGIFRVSDGSSYETVKVKESFFSVACRCNQVARQRDWSRIGPCCDRRLVWTGVPGRCQRTTRLCLPSAARFGLSSPILVAQCPRPMGGASAEEKARELAWLHYRRRDDGGTARSVAARPSGNPPPY